MIEPKNPKDEAEALRRIADDIERVGALDEAGNAAWEELAVSVNKMLAGKLGLLEWCASTYGCGGNTEQILSELRWLPGRDDLCRSQRGYVSRYSQRPVPQRPHLLSFPKQLRKWAARLERRGAKKSRRPSFRDRPLTAKQTEAVQIVGECKGNITEAAQRLGCDPKTIRQHYNSAMKKLGKAGVRKIPVRRPTKLPESKRGEADAYRGPDGQARTGRHLYPTGRVAPIKDKDAEA